MAERIVRVRLQAEVADFKRQWGEATRAVDNLPKGVKAAETSMGRMVQSAKYNREAWDRAGQSLTLFGTATLAGLGLATKAAMDWESAWTGVLKTVDGSDAELLAIEQGLRDLTRVLPASHQEIAAVAEAAGQLGISTGGILDFTKTMIDLGETTNLSAEEAATALARIGNIMGTTEGDVSRMGATIVDLGNNSATTEREIVELATRLAAAGKQAGLTEAEVFAFASTLTSVGVEAEAGGTAMSKVFTSIGDAVRDGGAELDTFARVAGVSAEDFRAAFEQDAASAIGMFVEGMGRASAAGESTTQIFEDLELTDERLKRSILSTGSATGLLGEQLEVANGAWEENTALVEEAGKRYDTAEAKLQIAKNGLNDAAITIGESFLPALASAAEGVASFAQWLGALPQPVLTAASGIGAVAGAAALAGGAFLLTFPRVMDTVQAFKSLSDINPKVATGLGRVGKAAGIAGGAAAGFIALTAAVEAFATNNSASSVEQTTKALLDMQDVTTDLDSLFTVGRGVDQVAGLSDAITRLTSPTVIDRMQDFGGTIRGVFGQGGTARTEVEEQFDAVGQSLASLVQSGNAEKAADLFAGIEAEWVAGGGAAEELTALMPAYGDALAAVDNEQSLAAVSAEGVTGALEEQIPTLEDVISLQAELAGVVLTEREAQRGLEAAIDAVTESLEANGKTLDITTEKGRANQSALDDVAKSGWALIESMQANGATQEELQASMTTTRQKFLDAALAMGLSGDEANALADELNLIPENVFVDVAVETAQARGAIDTFIRDYNGRRVQIKVDAVSGSQVSGPSGTMRFQAAGGYISGPGTATSDSIPARLSNGEYVIKASAVSKYGKATFDAINSMRFATGGYVGTAPAASAQSGGGLSGPLVNVERVIQGTPQDVGREVAWAMVGRGL